MATHPYSLRDAEKLLGLPRAAIRSLIRGGYVPDTRGRQREYRLSFQDMVMLKAARGLIDARISPARIARSLARLRATQTVSAGALHLSHVGGDLTRRNQADHSVESGQLLLDFGAPAGDTAALLSFRVPQAPGAAAAGVQPSQRSAAQWISHGVAIEARRPEAAIEAYRRAIDLEEACTAAYVNLGIVLSERGRLREASDVLQLAIVRCPPEAVLHFNLGTVFEDLERPAAAIEQYERALQLQPLLADAHYNLGRLHEQLGHMQLAIRHFNQFRKLDGDGR